MPPEKTNRIDHLTEKKESEIQEMVDELELQAKIAEEEGLKDWRDIEWNGSERAISTGYRSRGSMQSLETT